MPTPPAHRRSFLPVLRRFLAREWGVLLLLAATFSLLAWQRWGMNRLILLDRNNPRIMVRVVEDRPDGGKSICKLSEEPDQWFLTYNVRSGGTWAYCGINFAFVRPDSNAPGIDLTRFDTLVVNLTGMTGPNSSLQTQIKTHDSELVKSGIQSLKHQNMILLPDTMGPSRTKMPLDFFVIPPWWVARFNVPIRFQRPDRGDVREIEFMTSPDIIRLGKGTFGIRSLELRGKWIDQNDLLRILFALWLAYIGGGMAWRLYRSFLSIRRLERQARALQELADHDPLTRLHNRRGLESSLDDLAESDGDSSFLAIGVLMLDLDHFKRVNDTWGHDIGDQILRNAAHLILQELRPGNLCARWGGEEFVAVFPGISPTRLRMVAEHLRRRFERELEWEGTGITTSIGIAHGELGEFSQLVRSADDALYRAKDLGRNRVEESSPA